MVVCICNYICCRAVYQDYCEAMKQVSLAIMEVIGVSLGVGRSSFRDFFADGGAIMRCNYYPPCPEPERALGTGPHCDPSALTLLLQDGAVDGLQVLVDGEWRPVRPRPGALVVNIGDTFMVRTLRAFVLYSVYRRYSKVRVPSSASS
jgi:isopenicillin N synthase-like dioxygenase